MAAGADGCHFIVDLERPAGAETELEPNYARYDCREYPKRPVWAYWTL